MIEPTQVKNIICFRNDRFGEFLLNIPAFRALKKAYPGAKLTLIVSPYVEDLALGIDGVDGVVTWENARHKLSEIIKFSRQIKGKKFDLCVIFNPSKESNVISFLAGIPLRIGYNRKLGFLLTHKLEDRKYLGEKHEIEYNLELAGLAGAQTEDTALSLSVGERIIDSRLEGFGGMENPGSLIALHPWTSDPVKQWPIDRFLELAERLAGLEGIKVAVIGGLDEASKSIEFCASLQQNNIINTAGSTTLRQLAAFLKRCRLLISGDSGPIHLASAVNTPVIALFRSDITAKGAKRWGPWGAGHMVIEKNSLNDISADEVFRQARQMLDKCIKKY